MGKVGSMLASLLGQKTRTGLPQGHWDPRIPPSYLHSAPHPSSGCILRAVPSQGSCKCLLFQLLPLKGGDHPSIPIPSLGCRERLPISISHSILVHFQSLLPSLEVANLSLRPGEPSQVGLLLDLSKLPLGWQFWSLRVRHYVNLFCDSSMMLHDAWSHAKLGSPFPNAEESHVKAKLGEGIHNSPYFPCHLVPTALLSPHGLPPCSNLKLPSSRWDCVPSDGSSF